MKREPIVFKSATLTDAASPSRAWRLAVASRNENLDPGRSRCEERALLGDYCIRSPLSETGAYRSTPLFASRCTEYKKLRRAGAAIICSTTCCQGCSTPWKRVGSGDERNRIAKFRLVEAIGCRQVAGRSRVCAKRPFTASATRTWAFRSSLRHLFRSILNRQGSFAIAIPLSVWLIP